MQRLGATEQRGAASAHQLIYYHRQLDMLLGRAAGLTGGQLQSLDPSSMRGYFKLSHPIFSGTSLSDSIPALLPAYHIIKLPGFTFGHQKATMHHQIQT